MSREVAISRCAARQHALVTLEQARMCGFTGDAIRRRVEAGRWRRMRHGVYLLNGVPETWEQAALAAVLASGPEAVASHSTFTDKQIGETVAAKLAALGHKHCA